LKMGCPRANFQKLVNHEGHKEHKDFLRVLCALRGCRFSI
jgi:hypothetical protein